MLIYLMNVKGALRSCLAGWQDIFSLANRVLAQGGLPALYQMRIISTAPRNLALLPYKPKPDLVLIPVMLGDNFPELENQLLLRTIMHWHQQGIMLASACAGSFLLAAAGVFNGHAATTHWSLADRFRNRFPAVHLNEGELLVETPAAPDRGPGALLCGGGITAYIDVALSLISRSGGQALADRVSRTLLWDPHRPRQAVYADETPKSLHGDEIILKAEAWALTHLNQQFGLPIWAKASGLELRSFERRFRQALCMTPGVWLRRQRLQRARELCATSQRSWEEISTACAYQDSGNFREIFRKEFGLGPREYRSRFGTQR